jgi:hypothetical protein
MNYKVVPIPYLFKTTKGQTNLFRQMVVVNAVNLTILTLSGRFVVIKLGFFVRLKVVAAITSRCSLKKFRYQA